MILSKGWYCPQFDDVPHYYCEHPEFELVDEWDETESDPYRATDQTFHVLKFECCNCGKTWTETA